MLSVKIERDVVGKYPSYLNDESGLVSGNADKIFFPENENDVKDIMKKAQNGKIPVTISGGGTGISGGRVPLNGWILATDAMTKLDIGNMEWTDPEFNETFQISLIEFNNEAILLAPVAMRLKSIQNFARENGWFYPPDPTERSAFIGGNVSTNASGARSFKYGSTKKWVVGLRAVLPDGSSVSLCRWEYRDKLPEQFFQNTDVTITKDGRKFIIHKPGKEIVLPFPTYELPNVTKNVAGLVWTDDSEPLDIFIGSNGIFGAVTAVALKLIRPPQNILSILIFCKNNIQALEVIKLAQNQRRTQNFPIPMSVEYLDDRAVEIMHGKDHTIPNAKAAIILEQDLTDDLLDNGIEFWVNSLDKLGIESSSVAQTHKEIEHHKFLRHLIPETINLIVRKNGQPKLGTDYSVPDQYFPELLELAKTKGDEFESQRSDQSRLGYAIWAHAGDSHLHLNFLPATLEEVKRAKQMMVEIMSYVVSVGGSIAAEHGLGKKKFNGKPAIVFQYGEKGLQEIRNLKQKVDPTLLLNRGNIIGV